MNRPRHSFVEANGIRMHVVEQGAGPLVVLCHGFPETWHSWRSQIDALATAGFRVVAPDMRGYGDTDAPAAIDQYTLLHLVGDMVGLLDALGAATAVIAGHDWGAPVAWHAALLRPDRFRAVIGLSVPFMPRATARPTSVMPRTDDAMFYQLYYQVPGPAEAEMEQDPRRFLRTNLFALSGDGPLRERGLPPPGQVVLVPRQGGVLKLLYDFVPSPPELPGWVTEADVDVCAAAFARTGFRGGLNWYRNIDRNWELLAPFAGLPVTVPALYIVGSLDVTLAFRGMQATIAAQARHVSSLRQTLILPGCGHWTQQERSAEVNAAIIGFLRGLEHDRVWRNARGQ